MSNKLEGFVKDNKRAFEVKGPSDQLWERISAELDKKKQPKRTIKMYQWMSIAAMLVISVGIYFTYNYKQANNRTIEVADISSEFGQKEVTFVNQIEEKRDSLAVYASANPDLYKRFTEDLKNLDEDYNRLKAQLPTSPNQLLIVKAMVKNREMQLQILKQQLMIINQVNQYKKENTI